MRAMVLEEAGRPLVEREVDDPAPAEGQILLEVSTCGVCRTDLHIFDGELAEPKLPLIMGHQIVGRVVEAGSGVATLGIPGSAGVPSSRNQRAP